LLLRLGSDLGLAPRLVSHTLSLSSPIPLRRNLLRPTHAYDKTLRQLFQRSIASVVRRQKFPAQIISIRFPHIDLVTENRQAKSTLFRNLL
jgi:hypothetical protein